MPANLLLVSGIVGLLLFAPAAIIQTLGALFGSNGPTWQLGWSIFASASAWIVILGALKMKHLESRTLALAACILSLLPISPCWIPLSLPVGIWGLVVLNRREITYAFGAVAAARSAAKRQQVITPLKS